MPVTVARATVQDLPVSIAVSGTVRALKHAVVAPKIMAVVEQLPITLGQRVAAGDVLAELAASDLAARVAQVRTQLAQAKRDLERDTRLAAGGAATEDTVRISTDRVALAAAALDEAQVTLGYATLRAPFAGVISRRYSYAGDLAVPGQPLLELEGSDAFEIEARIPDSLARQLSPGTRLRVELPGENAGFLGEISELSSSAESSARSVTAKITVPAGIPVHSGQFVRVEISGEPARTILVPTRCVSSLGQMQRVFVVSAEQRASLRIVKTGATRADGVEIASGLDGDEILVLDAPNGLTDQQLVKVSALP